jgi:electron transfer flavoprotein alpha subunit
MIAVVAETKDGSARKITLEMLAEARRLAQAKGRDRVGVIVLGALAAGEADRLAQQGADAVYHVEGDALSVYAPEAYAEGVRLGVEKAKPDVLFIGATAHGKDLAPRVAARLRVGLASDCVGFEWKDGLIARRPIFAGKAFARVGFSSARPQVASIRPNTFTPTAADASRKAAVETIPLAEVKVRARVTGFERAPASLLGDRGRGCGAAARDGLGPAEEIEELLLVRPLPGGGHCHLLDLGQRHAVHHEPRRERARVGVEALDGFMQRIVIQLGKAEIVAGNGRMVGAAAHGDSPEHAGAFLRPYL